jgi:predicted lipoprotein with Yx(FWY)xxD motif
VKMLRPIALAALLSLALTAAAGSAAVSGESAAGKVPVIKLKVQKFGNILATRGRLPLYYWTPEKKDHKIHCTGRCAKVWPPVILQRGQSMPKRLPGVKGTFGVIQRPDGRRQVTWNRLPLYAYHNDPPGTVLCNNVDGWFVVRV